MISIINKSIHNNDSNEDFKYLTSDLKNIGLIRHWFTKYQRNDYFQKAKSPIAFSFAIKFNFKILYFDLSVNNFFQNCNNNSSNLPSFKLTYLSIDYYSN